MNTIPIRWPWNIEPDERLSGVGVMFDVNAASTNIAALLSVASELYVTDRNGLSDTLSGMPDAILVGESKDPEIAKKFQIPNNAVRVDRAVTEGVFAGRRVVLLTTNGTHVLLRLMRHGASPVISVSYANLSTAASWLKVRGWGDGLTLVPAGGHEIEFEDDRELVEDRVCAEALSLLLQDKAVDLEECFIASRLGIRRQYTRYQGRWNTESEDLELVFQKEDRYRVVPVCTHNEKGLVRVFDAMKMNHRIPNF